MNIDDFKDENWNKKSLPEQKDILQKAFCEANWNQLSDKQKEIVALHLASYSQRELGYSQKDLGLPEKTPTITFGTLQTGYSGGYDPDTPLITLNKDLLKNDQKEELINTTFHETRHAFQVAAINHPDKIPNIGQEKVEKWRENQSATHSYYEATSRERSMYISQAVERDGFEYGDMKASDFHSAKVFETKADIEAYEKAKIYEDKIENALKNSAESALGTDYARKTDLRAKGDYLLSQAASLNGKINFDNNLSSEVKQEFNKLDKQINSEALISTFELKKMTEEQLQGKEQRLEELQQKLIILIKNNDIKVVASNASSQLVAKIDGASDNAKQSNSVQEGDISGKDTTTHSTKIGELRRDAKRSNG